MSQQHPVFVFVDTVDVNNHLFDTIFGSPSLSSYSFIDIANMCQYASRIWAQDRKLPIVILQVKRSHVFNYLERIKNYSAFASILPVLVIAQGFDKDDRIRALKDFSVDALIDYPLQSEVVLAQINSVRRKMERSLVDWEESVPVEAN